MKVKSITIKNIGLIENETIEFNKPLLLFYGDIRQGKTTILNAVRWAFGGSFPADIIRHGQSEAVIDIVFDNGSINRSFYVNKEGETTARPQSIVLNGRVAKVSDLKQFLNPFLLNQSHLADMNKKDERSNFIIDLFGVNTVDMAASAVLVAERSARSRSSFSAMSLISMGSPLFMLMCVRAISVFKRAAHPLPPTAVNPARRVFPRGDYLVTVDAQNNALRSVCRLGAVGGFSICKA